MTPRVDRAARRCRSPRTRWEALPGLTDAGGSGDVGEPPAGAGTLVAKQAIAITEDRQVEIRESVVVKVPPRNPLDERRDVEPELRGDVGIRSVSVVAVELAWDVCATPPLVADEEVEPAVAVDVDERRRNAPPAIPDARLGGDVGKRGALRARTYTIVAPQLVGTEVGEVEIRPAVIVVIPGRHAHAVARRLDPALRGHVGETDRPGTTLDDEIVAKKPIMVLPGGLASAQHMTLDEVDVEITVLVVIK